MTFIYLFHFNLLIVNLKKLKKKCWKNTETRTRNPQRFGHSPCPLHAYCSLLRTICILWSTRKL